MTEPNSSDGHPDAEDSQGCDELKPTCEGMADVPGAAEEDSSSKERTR